MRKTIFSSVLAGYLTTLAVFAMATPVTAWADTQDERHRVVHYSDLDLNYPKDQKVLDRRIRAAARAVCDAPVGTRLPSRCVKSAERAAWEEIRSRGLIRQAQQGRLVYVPARGGK